MTSDSMNPERLTSIGGEADMSTATNLKVCCEISKLRGMTYPLASQKVAIISLRLSLYWMWILLRPGAGLSGPVAGRRTPTSLARERGRRHDAGLA